MAVATYADVELAIGRPIPEGPERNQVEYWLNAAELLIKSRLGDVTLLDEAAVTYVEAESVAARLRNPDGYASESIDDYTYRFGSETRQVAIRPEWWGLLSPLAGAEGYSTRPGFEPDTYAVPESL